MSVWQNLVPSAPLCGVEGDLLSVRLTVEAFLLEDLLEVIAGASFPINPEIRHHAAMETARGSKPAVLIEFPVWRSQIQELRTLLSGLRFEVRLGISPMIEEIRA